MMKENTLKSATFALAKLTGAACTILAIGGIFLTMNPDPVEPVKEAEADIFELGLGPQSKEESFVQSLKELGMEKPRPYDWNGNKFYFSMKQTKQPPLEVMREFQQKFEENGVNAKAYLTEVPKYSQATPAALLGEVPKEERERSIEIYKQNLTRLDDFFTGGVIPIEAREDYIAMAGSSPREASENSLEFLKHHIRSNKSLGENVAAMRFVDAQRNPHTGMTTVTATWSDKDLDVKKLTNRSDTMSLNVDPDIPSCMGCERIMRFAGEGDESNYTSHVFAGKSPAPQTADFYDRALRARGWAPSDSSFALERFMDRGVARAGNAKIRSYARGREFITVLVYPDSRNSRTIAHLLESP